MNYMGVDIGTSGCKAVVFDAEGQQIVRSYREYNVMFTPDGGVELDSREVVDKCFQVIRECNSALAPGSVKALAISSQGEAFTAVSNEGEYLSNAMVSSDTRPTPQVRKWLRKFPEERLYQITGHTAHSVFTLFKLLWIKENRPDVWENTHKFFCFEDLLHFHFGIEPGIGWSLAGRTMLFDVRKHCWSEEILSDLELESDKLARPMPSGEIVGEMNSDTAKLLGFSDSVLVVSGGHDQVCSALGAGVIRPGMAMYASGTVDCISPCFEMPIFNDDLRKSNLCTYDHAIIGLYTSVAYSLTGGNILKWFRDEFGMEEVNTAGQTGRDAYELILSHCWDKPSDLLVLPYFTPSGTPYFDAETKGAIFGFRISTKRGEFIRALLEGVTLEMRLNLNIIENSGYQINELSVVGGGAQSEKWSQLKADVTGKKINRLCVTEAGCMGAAMLACAATSGRNIMDLTDEWVKVESTLFPDKNNQVIYNEKFVKYKNLYQVVRNAGL